MQQLNGDPVTYTAIRQLEQALSSLAGGYTRFTALGVWEHKPEASYVYEVLTVQPMVAAARKLARVVAQFANQTCVLYTNEHVNAKFIGGRS